MQSLRLTLDGVHYTVRPDMRLLLQIEDELGALPALAEAFRARCWYFTDMISLLHMLLQHSGKTLDYHALGNLVLQTGVAECHRTVLRFFEILHLPFDNTTEQALNT